MTADMERSWLVQRLGPARQGALAEAFAFGGGLRNSGLSDNAMQLLRPIMSFEYMGSAEFEFGAVPQALRTLAEHQTELATCTVTIAVADVPKSFSDRSKTEPAGDATVYVLARDPHLVEACRRITGWATAPRADEFRTKDYVGLADVLRPGRYAPDTVGWFELDNGFMFFTDRGMWEAVCQLFGAKVPTLEVRR